MFKTRFIQSAILLILSMACLSFSSIQDDENSLALVGIVLVKGTQQPAESATVELIDLLSDKRQVFVTYEDGSFYFLLEPQRQYSATVIEATGAPGETRLISTTNTQDAEVLHTVLEQLTGQ